MNGYKILKCFRKEKCISGELPCPATGLIECALYVEIRQKYISKIKFIELLCTEKNIKMLSMYVDKAFKIRKENMPR